jgi:hypothetical protein
MGMVVMEGLLLWHMWVDWDMWCLMAMATSILWMLRIIEYAKLMLRVSSLPLPVMEYRLLVEMGARQ